MSKNCTINPTLKPVEKLPSEISYNDPYYDPHFQLGIVNSQICRIRNADGKLVYFDLYNDTIHSVISEIKYNSRETIVKGDSIYYFSKDKVTLVSNGKTLVEVRLPEGYKFNRSNSMRPIINDNQIIAQVNPKAMKKGENNYFLQRIDSSFMSYMNLDLKTSKVFCHYPDEFPYNQEEKQYIGNEFLVNFDVFKDTIFITLPFNSIIYYTIFSAEKPELNVYFKLENCEKLDDLGQNVFDEEWEQEDGGKYVASLSQLRGIHYLEKGKHLILFVKGLPYREGYISQLNRELYFIETDRPAGQSEISKMDGYEYLNYFKNEHDYYFIHKGNDARRYHSFHF